MKVNDPKITNYQVCTFKECTQNSEFNKVLIKENIDVRLDLTDYSFDECIFMTSSADRPACSATYSMSGAYSPS